MFVILGNSKPYGQKNLTGVACSLFIFPFERKKGEKYFLELKVQIPGLKTHEI